MKPYFRSADYAFNLLHGDTFELLPQFSFKFDMIFADPPYFLSSGGISVQSGKVVCVDKGNWDKSMSQDEINAFNLKWLSLCREKLKDNGTIWISGTYHNIFSVANCLTQLGYKILNVITWAKTNPPPNISCRYFTYSTEFIIWARKSEKVAHYYNYDLMKHINGDKQMTDVWRLPAIAPWEKTCTKHPTQKPLGLLSRIILASTKAGAWILDPFAGSSTTGIAANLLGRRFLGIEREEDFARISKSRREEIESPMTFATFKRKIPDIVKAASKREQSQTSLSYAEREQARLKVKAENTQTDCFMFKEDVIESLPFLDVEDTYIGNDVLMYAIGSASRKKTEPVGKLAIGLKQGVLMDTDVSRIGYIMFHYWSNERATPYRLTSTPRIVSKLNIPDGYLIRMGSEASDFLLVEYDASTPADIGTFDIRRVMKKGKGRYMPFVTVLADIQKYKIR